MAALFIPASETGLTILFGRLGRFIVSVIDVLSTWNDHRVTRKSLSKLSARELADIGLTKADVDGMGRR